MKKRPNKKTRCTVTVFGPQPSKEPRVVRPILGNYVALGASHVDFEATKHLLSNKPLRRPDRKPSKDR
ncbi:MAG TPA: hypothetical protein VE988_29870 [Gemmataceae bacterium]|nr:hypothetical protein [Gemmataceae bacterium]